MLARLVCAVCRSTGARLAGVTGPTLVRWVVLAIGVVLSIALWTAARGEAAGWVTLTSLPDNVNGWSTPALAADAQGDVYLAENPVVAAPSAWAPAGNAASAPITIRPIRLVVTLALAHRTP
jgi:hypothetical protein